MVLQKGSDFSNSKENWEWGRVLGYVFFDFGLKTRELSNGVTQHGWQYSTNKIQKKNHNWPHLHWIILCIYELKYLQLSKVLNYILPYHTPPFKKDTWAHRSYKNPLKGVVSCKFFCGYVPPSIYYYWKALSKVRAVFWDQNQGSRIKKNPP